MAKQLPEWEQDMAHELVVQECPECGSTATWTRDYTYGEDPVSVFTCRTCGHELHIHGAEVIEQVVQPEVAE